MAPPSFADTNVLLYAVSPLPEKADKRRCTRKMKIPTG